MATRLKLISHKLCPYVQRAVIALTEKAVPFERIDIDLADKPEWFVAISPLGKTPVLQVGAVPIFESAVILEYLEETEPHPLHPADPLSRAEHRAWIEFGSAVLNDIAGFYSVADETAFKAKVAQLEGRFADDAEKFRPAAVAGLACELGLSTNDWREVKLSVLNDFSMTLSLVKDLSQWNEVEKKALVKIIRAKTASDESSYLKLMQKHARLRNAMIRLGSQ